MADLSHGDHVRRNRAYWDRLSQDFYDPGRRAWEEPEPSWGLWSVPEASLGVVGDVAGLDVLEAGCGTAYWSAWLARRGARVAGVDNSPQQLAHAREFQDAHDLLFPLVHADAELLPFRDASFDLVISEYGASIWCDARRWIAEAARVLRPGGRLIFLRNGTLLMLTMPDEEAPAGDRLLRGLHGMNRFEWTTDESVEFHLPHGELIRLLRSCGFEVEDLIEVQAPPGATRDWDYVGAEWAKRWPSEEIWAARKRG